MPVDLQVTPALNGEARAILRLRKSRCSSLFQCHSLHRPYAHPRADAMMSATARKQEEDLKALIERVDSLALQMEELTEMSREIFGELNEYLRGVGAPGRPVARAAYVRSAC